MANSSGSILPDTANRLFARHITPRVLAEASHGLWAEDAWEAIEAAGLTRALLPADAGGFGLEPAEALGLLRVAGEHAVPLPLAETMLAGWLLASAGLEMPDGPLSVAPVTVGGALELRRQHGAWHIRGTAGRVPWAHNAGSLAVLAEQGGQWCVALIARRAAWEPGSNLAGEPRDTIRIDDAALMAAPTAVTGLQLHAAGAALRAQQIAGALSRITAITTDFAGTRVQFGRPIGRFQAVQQNLAVLAAQTAAAHAAADLAAGAFSRPLALPAIAAAKCRAGEAAGIAAAIAHQTHGAMGFTQEHPLHFLTRRLWSWRDEFGNEAEWQALLGRHMAAHGADRLWSEITAVSAASAQDITS